MCQQKLTSLPTLETMRSGLMWKAFTFQNSKRLACYILFPCTVLENISVYGPGTEIQLRSQLSTIALGFEHLCFLPEGLYGSEKCYRLAHQDPSATKEEQKWTDGYLNLLPVQGDNSEICPQWFSGFDFSYPQW